MFNFKKKEKDKTKLSVLKNKQKGSLFGLYIGDALGAPLEFKDSGTFEEITEYSYGGVHSVKIGQWTDDSSMALCLMDSLMKDGFDLSSQLENYIKWLKYGEFSSIGRCFDIGITVNNALSNYAITKDVYSGSKNNAQSGNGSIMRLAPVPIYFYNNSLEDIIKYSVESSKTTHGSPICLDSVGYFTSVLYSIFKGETDKDLIIKNKFYTPTDEDVIYLKELDYNQVVKYDLEPTGYVIHSLKCALWCFYKTNSFEEAVLKAVNLGGDSDTIGAIVGQIAGAYYGYDSIPDYYINNLMKKDYLTKVTDDFLSIC